MKPQARAELAPTPAPPFARIRSGFLQRECACGGSPGHDGECDECRQHRLALKPRLSGGRGFFVGSFGGHDFSRIRVSNLKPPRIQTKLEVSDPGDAWEQEADQAAAQVMRMAAPADTVVSSSPAQEAGRDSDGEAPAEAAGPASEGPAPAPEATTPASPEVTAPEAAAPEAAETPTAEEAPAAGLIVEDDAAELVPGQARKSDFLAELRTSICATADAVLAAVGRSTEGCPYIEYWIGYYSTQSSQYIERAIRKYAPETVGATAARDYIPLINERVRQGVVRWATTGEIAAPEGVPTSLPEAGAEGAAAPGGETRNIAFKRRDGHPALTADPREIRSELGGGQPLEGALRKRMESAFGHDFSRVRIHADSNATTLSDRLNARAFAVGEHVAFASGEYRPGTLVGDTLIAHELAHVVQQGGASASGEPLQARQADYNSMEEDADVSAVSAVVGLWGRGKAGLANIARNAMPRLRSGLQLSRCSKKVEKLTLCLRPVRIANDDSKNPTTLPSFASAQAIWAKCCVDLSINPADTVSKTAYKELDDPGVGDTPSGEETALFAAAGGSGACIPVFVPETFNDGTKVSKDISGGGVSYGAGTNDPKVVVVEGVDPTIVAHELGHAMGYLAHNPAGTIMEVTADRHDQKESDKVAAVICEQVRKFANAKATGKKECQMDV